MLRDLTLSWISVTLTSFDSIELLSQNVTSFDSKELLSQDYLTVNRWQMKSLVELQSQL